MIIKELITNIKSEINKDIDKSTLQYYDRIGLVRVPRSENGYRDYGDYEYKKVKLTLLLKDLGYSLSIIDMIMNKRNRRVILQVTEDLAEKEEIIETLRDLLYDLREK